MIVLPLAIPWIGAVSVVLLDCRRMLLLLPLLLLLVAGCQLPDGLHRLKQLLAQGNGPCQPLLLLQDQLLRLHAHLPSNRAQCHLQLLWASLEQHCHGTHVVLHQLLHVGCRHLGLPLRCSQLRLLRCCKLLSWHLCRMRGHLQLPQLLSQLCLLCLLCLLHLLLLHLLLHGCHCCSMWRSWDTLLHIQ